MKVWIDIENPPQVQYLLPFRDAFHTAGIDTVITARDYGSTLEMLRRGGVEAHAFGERAGRGKAGKVAAVFRRARGLLEFFERTGAPDALLGASRASAMVAWRLGIPGYLIGDYEHVHVTVYRLTGSTILHPEVIDPAVFRRKGLTASQLIPFRGLKEDLTFAGVDVDAVEPYDLGVADDGAVRVLFRPPSETSHYYREESSDMARTTLAHLARAGARVVFSPRDPAQVALLAGLEWRVDPVILDRPAPFIPLLKSVDLVVCSGGTMLREAAYLGIPAYSIFQSEMGEVDRWLERIGRATLLSDQQDLSRIELIRRGPLVPLNSNPDLIDDMVGMVTRHPRGTTERQEMVAA